MPKYLDSRARGVATEQQWKQRQAAPVGQDGVLALNIRHNRNENKLLCLTRAPNREAVDKDHQDLGMKCDWITEDNCLISIRNFQCSSFSYYANNTKTTLTELDCSALSLLIFFTWLTSLFSDVIIE
jgi:hypothetical protein